MKQVERAVYFCVIVLLTILNVSQTNRSKNRISSVLNSMTGINESARYVRQQEILSSDLPIPRDDLLISEQGDTISYDSIAKIPKVVLFINENLCLPCIDSIFEAAGTVFGSNSSQLLIVRSDIRTAADLKEYTRNFKTYYRVEENDDIPLMSSELPFFFFLDQDCLTKLLFIPDKTEKKNTLWYLNQMKERLSLIE